MSPYQQEIRETLARLGLVAQYDPADIEAWMRLETPTLDHLSRSRFTEEAVIACACILDAGPEYTASLRASFGFSPKQEVAHDPRD